MPSLITAGGLTVGAQIVSATDGAITIQSGPDGSKVNAIVVDATGSVSMPYLASQSFRNRIINGDCRVAQRGAVAAVNNTLTYGGCDRIAVAPINFTTMSGTIQQQNAGFGSVGLSQGFTGVTTTGTGTIQFIQRMEYLNSKDLNSKTVTVQAKVYQNTGGALNCGFVVSKAVSVDNFTSPTVLQTGATTSVPSGTLTTITTSFTFGASDCGNGLQFMAQFTGVGAVTSKDFHITDFQVEIGSTATPFEQRPYGVELALCQRYYQVVWPGGGLASGTSNYAFTQSFPVEMRATPTVSCSGTIICANGASNFNGGSTCTFNGDRRGGNFNVGGFAAALTANAVYIGASTSGVFLASAEL